MTMSSSSRYALRGLMAHLHATGSWPRLFDLLETKPFLADQVKGLGGFQASGEDLETYALAGAIEARDWQRFLHYAALALNLRGLAEDLTEPTILRALAGSNSSLSISLWTPPAGSLILSSGSGTRRRRVRMQGRRRATGCAATDRRPARRSCERSPWTGLLR